MMSSDIQINDVIRSYDFKPMVGRPDCYIEGKVVETNNTEQGYRAYKIVVTKDHFGDEVSTTPSSDSRVDHIMYVPVSVSFSEYAGRIINLSRM
jgi:hypothetical protein